ncbi:NAD(P)H-hydrate dehydratase, partial [Candidatus Pacearchaeota archaeon]
GFKGEPRDRYKEVIKAINQFKEKFGKVIISVDIPSGLEGDTGKAIECINADYTITFGYPKLGHFLFDGIKYCGNVFIKDIGFPKDIVYNNLKVKRFLIEEKDVVLPQRKRWFHKGKYGKVLVISGSLGFSGACSFVCNGAYKVGAGLVYAYVPKEINNVIDNLCPETVVFSPEIYDFENFVKFMNENAKNFNVIAMGPGLGRNELTKKMVNYVLDKFSDKKIVLDADAVYMSDKNILRGKKNVVITPHPGEFAHAFGYDISYLISNILRVVEGEVGGLGGGVIVAKGSPLTLISTVVNGEVYTYFNLEGNDGMATGGSGDVLTGIIAGLLAQGLSPLQASISGVFLHGRAGNMAMKKLNKYSVTASSILSFIPEAINSILNI